MIEATDVSMALDRFLKNLALDHTAHVAAQDGPEVLAENEGLSADVQEIRNLIVARASMRRDKRVKARKHGEILPLCAAAREEYERLSRAIEPANHAYLTACSSLENAEGRLNHHVANPLQPGTYPSSKEIRNWNMEKHRLERAVEERRLEVKAKNVEAGELRGRHLKAKQEFERLAFQERQLRPPEAGPRVIATSWHVQEAPELTPIGPNR